MHCDKAIWRLRPNTDRSMSYFLSQLDPACRRKRVLLCVLILGAAVGCFAESRAQSYPNRPIRVVVPFAAGGAVDTIARIIGVKLQDSVGQPVIVENRAGAGGTTGADVVAKAPPDGYTILMDTNGQAITPA